VINLEVTQHRGEVHVKAGYLHNGPYYTVKIASGFLDNPQLGLPPAMERCWCSTREQALWRPFFSIMDISRPANRRCGSHLCQTPGASKSGNDRGGWLGSSGPLPDPVAGTGQGFREVRIWGRDRGKAVACIEDLARDGLASDRRLVLASSVREAVEKADIVITVTASREPLVRADWIAREHW